MFSERDADLSTLVTGSADAVTLRKAEASGASASASITATDADHTLIPVRIEAFGTAPARTVGFADGTDVTITDNRFQDGMFTTDIIPAKADGYSEQIDSMTATNDGDAASGDTALVYALEVEITGTGAEQ